jgi:hypothetical protein
LRSRPDPVNIRIGKKPGELALATFKAIRVDKADKGTTVALTQFDEADLMDGDVTVRVE